MSNLYARLIEANRVYLNPTPELILANVNLNDHCYYHLIKYPPNKSNFWILLEESKLDWDLLIETLKSECQSIISLTEKTKSKKISKLNQTKLSNYNNLIGNLHIASGRDDIHYLQFLSDFKPKQKLQLKLIKKQTIIDPIIGEQLGFSLNETQNLDVVELKMAIHRYISDHQLQKNNQIKCNSFLVDILVDSSLKIDQLIHYFDFLYRFKLKYH